MWQALYFRARYFQAGFWGALGAAITKRRRHFAAILTARGMGVVMWILGVFSGSF